MRRHPHVMSRMHAARHCAAPRPDTTGMLLARIACDGVHERVRGLARDEPVKGRTMSNLGAGVAAPLSATRCRHRQGGGEASVLDKLFSIQGKFPKLATQNDLLHGARVHRARHDAAAVGQHRGDLHRPARARFAISAEYLLGPHSATT
jgi:hypothetical protein